MTGQPSDFERAVAELSSGSEQAVWEFIQTYGPHIQRLVRRRLHQSMRSKFDSIDFVQMVWASFFTDPLQIARFKTPNDLLRFLAAIARNKVLEESRRRTKFQKYNVNRERPLEQSELPESSRHKFETPSQFAIAQETWETMIDHQSERNQTILEMRRNGATFIEIGATLGIHERTVRQVVRKLEHAAIR
jgi:RNA polymerase sigma-70 factor (ECF subfamily)